MGLVSKWWSKKRASAPLPLTPENLQIYVIHYSPFGDRRRHMEKQITDHGLDRFPVRWITEYDREAIAEAHRKAAYCDPEKFNASHVSLILKHLECYRSISNSPVPYHLILEDDVFLISGFIDQLANILSELPPDWKFFFVGCGCNLHIPPWQRRFGKRVYLRKPHAALFAGAGISRCTEAYLINPDFAPTFLSTRKANPPFTRSIDWLINEAGEELKVCSHWAEPPLARQGAFESWTKNPSLNQ
ncbi:hypothetical protein BH11VER1_BH11VER1_10900 [soil metagenome]